ncbi:hypothetical protein B0H13DRAFT_2376032 [Mycena leptocephala]|nr:hypothetical protein B0H13DRAFT_2376032 [Mycena leptocephala]
MSDTQIPMFIPASAPSLPTSTSTSSTRILRERCGFTLFISFGPAFPSIPAKGHIGPTAGNLPRRKRSSVISLELPAPVPSLMRMPAAWSTSREAEVVGKSRKSGGRLPGCSFASRKYQIRSSPGSARLWSDSTLNNLVLIP